MSTPTFTPQAHTSAARRWAFFVVISFGLFLIALDNSILYTALPELNTQLRTTSIQALWIINAYPLVLSGLLLGTGTLGDKIGHRVMFLTGLVIFGTASLAAAFSPNAWALIIARAFLGMGAATMMPATLSLIRLTFPDERERNTAIGIWGSITVAGAAAGPVVGGALLEKFWWGSIFLINVPLVVACIVATLLLAPPNLPNPNKRWDFISSVYALLSLSGLTMTIKESVNTNRSAALLAGAIACCVIGSVLFAQRQRRLEDPLLTFDIFRSRIFAGGAIAAGGAMFVMIGVELMTTQKFQLADGFSPLQAGLVVAAMSISAFPASTLGGAYLHKIGFLPLISGGFVISAAAVAATILATRADNFPLIITAMVFVGLGAGFTMSVASIAIIGAAPMHRTGMAVGVEEVSYEFGSLLTVAATGSLIPLFLLANLPANLQARGMDAVYDRVPEAANAYGEAYLSVLLILGVFAVIFAAVTAWCFKDNPKSGGNGGAH